MVQVGEEVTHLLTLGIQHRLLRILGHRGVEVAAQRDDEAACIEETVIGTVGDRLDIRAVDVIELGLDHPIKVRRFVRRQPLAEGAEVAQELLQSGFDHGKRRRAVKVLVGGRHPMCQRLSCLIDVHSQRRPGRLHQAPESFLVLQARRPSRDQPCDP
ncbi:hypothetical protein OG884_27775 [Streptosporangium sp. NBC_01755]|uniref:hypothetical protein n=1 Tax=Streptosporangium sp. NBC_01755 TaxID=2975949 RepID=UPI002DDC533C|nr:hypothetical protein [Streptosporangium sp. NBC_01755]WSC98640.1 hypothetical protein OG884_27775 [Streptosporangium sp. NBC_01755]